MTHALLCLLILGAEPDRSIDFDTEIIPVLTKAGCNGGACHGAAAGRGGFHLSLLGADPESDYESIVRSFEGRRINPAYPTRSLVLAKPTGQLDHGGDVALEFDGPGAERILDWIRGGAERGPRRKLTSFEVSPRRHLAADMADPVPLQAVARFDNGPPEEVTRWTVFTSSDPAALEIDEQQVARVKRRGQHVAIARFLDRVVPVQFLVPFSDQLVDVSAAPRANFIDDEILQTLSALRLPVSPPASDAEYLRRVSLDLTGRLPDPVESEAFLSDPTPDKRARLVERLLASDAFADLWTLRWGRMLRLHSLPNDQEGARAYADWLRREIDRGTAWNELARQLLTATGDSHEVGPANFARMVSDARDHAELVGRFFLGVRLGCANCHNHPLDRWTQDDYHGLAAVFARLERGRTVQVSARGAVTNLRTGEPAVPRIPGERFLEGDEDHRSDVANWLAATDMRYFPRATVNRLWQAMFGRGLVEPADDLRETNPATHPELLSRLADDFVQHGYSVRHTLRLIASSHAYARSAAVVAGNERDDRFYSHAYRRPLEPEVLADAIADVTGVPDEFPGQPAGTRAVHVVDPLVPSLSLDILGRCSRADGCDDDTAAGGGLPAQLHLLNGELINDKLSAARGRLQQMLSAGASDAEIVDQFFLRALVRHPAEPELSAWRERLAAGQSDQRSQRLEDFVWSVLNSRQFIENH
jgi:hypothetical protein